MIVALIIILATLENIWPIIAGYAATPKGAVFLGTIHHPGDYFYYLSQFAQGTTRWFTARDLYTSESIPPSFVGWSNVLLGHILHLIGFSPINSYHLSVLLLTLLLLTTAYFLARAVLNSRAGATLALYLFALYHAFPIRDHGVLTYSDYWINYAVPNVRLGGVPHQLLIAILSFISMLTTIVWLKQPQKWRWRLVLGLAVSGMMLASLQPALWALLIGSFALASFIYGLLERYKLKQLSTLFIPCISICLGGLLPAIYLTKLFSQLPFIQLKLWEAAQHNQLSFSHFLLATGPIFLITLMSVPSFLTAKNSVKLLVFTFAFCSFLLFLSPFPALLGITEVRFMSTLTILVISIIAAYGLSKLRPRGFSIGILTLLTLILLPNHFKMLSLTTQFDPGNAYQYLSVSDYSFLVTAANRSHSDRDIYLIIWPYNVVFPGLTGKRSFNGHPLLTMSSQGKDVLSQRFFEGSMPEDEMQRLITENGVTYVLAYTWTPKLESLLFLKLLRSAGPLVLYRVIPF